MKIWLWEIRRIPKPEPEVVMTTREALIDVAEEMTELWNQAYVERENITPWIDWVNKEVIICERDFSKTRVYK